MKHYLILIGRYDTCARRLISGFHSTDRSNPSCNYFVQRIHESVRSDFTRYSAGRKSDRRAEKFLKIKFDTRAE